MGYVYIKANVVLKPNLNSLFKKHKTIFFIDNIYLVLNSITKIVTIIIYSPYQQFLAMYITSVIFYIIIPCFKTLEQSIWICWQLVDY